MSSTAAPAPAQPTAPADCRPLPPPPSREMPEALRKALPSDDQGRPVIAQQGGVGLAYDSQLDDPITRWAACLSRVTAVLKANGPGKVAHCIDSVKLCPTDEGGPDCCPKACIDEFKQAAAREPSEMKTLAVFSKGSCVKGLPEPRGAR